MSRPRCTLGRALCSCRSCDPLDVQRLRRWRGHLTHLVPNDSRVALCGAEPFIGKPWYTTGPGMPRCAACDPNVLIEQRAAHAAALKRAEYEDALEQAEYVVDCMERDERDARIDAARAEAVAWGTDEALADRADAERAEFGRSTTPGYEDDEQRARIDAARAEADEDEARAERAERAAARKRADGEG